MIQIISINCNDEQHFDNMLEVITYYIITTFLLHLKLHRSLIII